MKFTGHENLLLLLEAHPRKRQGRTERFLPNNTFALLDLLDMVLKHTLDLLNQEKGNKTCTNKI